MKSSRPRRRSSDTRTPPKLLRRKRSNATEHQSSPTAVAAEALRTGVLPGTRPSRSSSREDDDIRVGDPDDDVMSNEYVGEDTPGGSTPTPDQNGVDEIGRAYGLQEEDTGALRSGSEILARRDRKRVELQAPRKPDV